MRVSLKKTLATVLSVALVLTTCMCALTVGAAATVAGRIEISDNEAVVSGESFEVPATITLDASSQFVEVAYTLDLPEGFTLESVVAEDASVASVSVDANSSVISISARGPVESIALVMTLATTLTTFDAFDLGVAKVEYADVSEADLTLNIEDTGRIALSVVHGASDAYAYDDTNHWNVCVADGCEDATHIYNKAEHAWVAGEKVDATCQAEGSQEYSCVCGATKTEKIAIVAHTPGEAVKENEVVATCTTKGSYDMVTYCTVGGEELSRETVEVPVTDHTAGEAAKENIVDATCTTAGSYDMVVRCTVCNEVISTESFVIDALGHNYETVVTAPTCTEAGYTTYTCSVCGDSYVADETDALGHTNVYTDNGDGTHDATCSVCSVLVIDNEAHTFVEGNCVCGAVDVTPCTGDHTYTAASVTKENVVAATETAEGSYDMVVRCDECRTEILRYTINAPKLPAVEDDTILPGVHSTAILDTLGIGFRIKKSTLPADTTTYKLEVQRYTADITNSSNYYNFVLAETQVLDKVGESSKNDFIAFATYYGVELYSMSVPIAYTVHCYDAKGVEKAYKTYVTTTAEICMGFHDLSTTREDSKKVNADIVSAGAAAQKYFRVAYPNSQYTTNLLIPEVKSDYLSSEISDVLASYDYSDPDGVQLNVTTGVQKAPYFNVNFSENSANKDDYRMDVSYKNKLDTTHEDQIITLSIDGSTMNGSAKVTNAKFDSLPLYAGDSEITFKLWKKSEGKYIGERKYCMDTFTSTQLKANPTTERQILLKQLYIEVAELGQAMRVLKNIVYVPES